MNVAERGRDGGDAGSQSEEPQSAVDQEAFTREEMPSIIVSRANLLAQAKVPVGHIQKILNGQYDLWDDDTVFWDDRFPGKGKLVMQLLRPVYDAPCGLTSVPSDTMLAYVVGKAFPPLPRGPLPRMRGIALLTLSQFKQERREPKWLDEFLDPGGTAKGIDNVFPWAPVESRLRASGFYEFEAYGDVLPGDLRERLWTSVTHTLRSLWMHIDGIAPSPSISNPWLIRDMWTLGNCLPIGFSGSTDSFFFLLPRR
jgi:hypothetical protein